MRYEKCLDPEMTVTAIARFVNLLQKYDAESTVVSALTDDYAYHYEKVELNFNKSFVDKYTGIEISNDTIIKTLTSLGFTASVDNDEFTVDVPSWRATKDVTMKADIIEEITRIYGYDNFDVHTCLAPLYPVRPDVEKTVEDKIKDLLVKRFSLHELHSYVWAYYDELKALGIDVEGEIKLEGASNPNIETIRKVVTGLDENNLCVEKKKLAITLFSKVAPVSVLFYKLRDILEVMSDDIKHKSLSFEPIEATSNYQHPRNLNRIICDGVEIGQIGIVHPTVQKKIDKKAAIVFAEVDVEAFANIENASIQYVEPSKFPEIEVDLSFVSQKFAPIAKAIAETRSPLIKNVYVTDIYDDENDGTRSITTRIVFSHSDKTLTRDEVQEVTDSIIESLKNDGIELKS